MDDAATWRKHQLLASAPSPASIRSPEVRGGHPRKRVLARLPAVGSCCSTTSGPTIKTWTLCIPEMVWKEDSILSVKRLWATAFKSSRLPLWVPRFPVVDAQDQDIIHFVLLGPNYHDRVWIVTIDMKMVTLKSYKNYRNAEQRDEYKGLFMYKPFICSVLSKYTVGPSDWQVDENGDSEK